MISKAWRSVVRFLGSAACATWLLVLIGAWSIVATLVPQVSDAGPDAVAAWAAAHPAVEPVAQGLGLHRAFDAPLFMLLVFVLGVSTALCAWERTKFAATKARTLRKAARAEEQSLVDRHDFVVECDPVLSESEVMSIASDTLGRLGVRAKRRGDLLSAVSPEWTVWGSPVFHWALLAIVLAILIGSLQRSEGQMGLAVGQTLPDAPESYGLLFTGPLHDWSRVHRSIRVDAFEPAYHFDGIDRGPTPTVSVLDGSGNPVKTQRVYPNMTLKTGTLTIYPVDFGLAAAVALLDSSGAETGRGVQIVDFDPKAPGGTSPSRYLVVSDAAGNALLKLYVSIPLDGVPGDFEKRLPAKPAARVVATSLEDQVLLDRIAGLGDVVDLPSGGGSLRLLDVGYYARISLVDDWSIPLIYLGLVVATLGLSVATLARQQIVLATTVVRPNGVALAARIRLWRNESSSRSEIEGELTRALGAADEGNVT